MWYLRANEMHDRDVIIHRIVFGKWTELCAIISKSMLGKRVGAAVHKPISSKMDEKNLLSKYCRMLSFHIRQWKMSEKISLQMCYNNRKKK